MVKNKEIITSEFDRLLTAYGVNECSELPSSTTEGREHVKIPHVLNFNILLLFSSPEPKAYSILYLYIIVLNFFTYSPASLCQS